MWGRAVSMGLGWVMLTRAGEKGSLVPSRHHEGGGKPNAQVCPWLALWPTTPAEAFLATRLSPTALGNQMSLIPRDTGLREDDSLVNVFPPGISDLFLSWGVGKVQNHQQNGGHGMVPAGSVRDTQVWLLKPQQNWAGFIKKHKTHMHTNAHTCLFSRYFYCISRYYGVMLFLGEALISFYF